MSARIPDCTVNSDADAPLASISYILRRPKRVIMDISVMHNERFFVIPSMHERVKVRRGVEAKGVTAWASVRGKIARASLAILLRTYIIPEETFLHNHGSAPALPV